MRFRRGLYKLRHSHEVHTEATRCRGPCTRWPGHHGGALGWWGSSTQCQSPSAYGTPAWPPRCAPGICSPLGAHRTHTLHSPLYCAVLCLALHGPLHCAANAFSLKASTSSSFLFRRPGGAFVWGLPEGAHQGVNVCLCGAFQRVPIKAWMCVCVGLSRGCPWMCICGGVCTCVRAGAVAIVLLRVRTCTCGCVHGHTCIKFPCRKPARVCCRVHVVQEDLKGSVLKRIRLDH